MKDWVEVAYATPVRQHLRRLPWKEGLTAAAALQASGLLDECPEVRGLSQGLWGRPCTETALLKPGDRLELYRPLRADPKEARRGRVEADRRSARGSATSRPTGPKDRSAS